MANVLINEDTMTDIADAIREKKGVATTYLPSEMPDAIASISGGGVTPTGTKSITENGTYDVTNFASAEVNVPTGGSSYTVISTGSFSGANNVRIDLDSTWFDTYDLVVIRVTGTISASDWLYVVFNATSTGTTYSDKTSSFDYWGVADRFVTSAIKAMFSTNRSTAFHNSAQYLYLYAYSSSNTIAGTYEIRGIKM